MNVGNGYSYAMPMNHFYYSDDGCIYFHSGKVGHRLDALRLSDKVSFCVCEQSQRDEGEWAYNVRSVIVFGRMEIIDDIDEITAIVTKLSYKFTHDKKYIETAIKNYRKATLLLKLTPEHI